MAKDMEREIDDLKGQIDDIKKMLALKLLAPHQADAGGSGENIQKAQDAEPEPAVAALLERMGRDCDINGESGRVTSLGVFASGGKRSAWIGDEINTDELFRLIESRAAENVLNCIGSNDRLTILLTLLREPMTVAALVEECGYHTTGQVYHHLKPLIAADLVREDKGVSKGTYTVQPHRVQGFLMLLAGVHSLVKAGRSEGVWGTKAEIHSGAVLVDERYMVTGEETQKIIDAFFISTDPLRLKNFSSKEKKKLVILQVIAEQFESGKRYGEKEVNRILEAIYPDYASIRRHLIEYGFMGRTQDCTEYWLKEPSAF